MTRPEFLKAIRALSSRYVERRGTLPDRSPLDSAGKRAAFAGFYAPLHFLTARAVVRALDERATVLDTLYDMGCGTGVACAAWALEHERPPAITGVDLISWALDDARRNWRSLDLPGRASRGDFVAELEGLAARTQPRRAGAPARRQGRLDRTGIVLGWSLNELDAGARARAARAIETLAAQGARILAIEPVSRRLVPWWDDWAARCAAAGARADEWRFRVALPPALAALDRDAGFDRDGLTARSLAFNL
jgi:hypothetical protein